MPAPSKRELAEQFINELSEQGQQLSGRKGGETIVLKSKEGEHWVHFWKLDVMVYRFMAAHAALAYASVSEVVNEVLSIIA
jgi:hypothetical protein